MDVGNPSNFARMQDLFQEQADGSTWNNMKATLSGYAYDDDTTRQAIREVYEKYQYVLEPHGAVAYLALKEYQQKHPDTTGVILETAHPAKFLDDMEAILSHPLDIPERLARLADLPKSATFMKAAYADFHQWLMEHYT